MSSDEIMYGCLLKRYIKFKIARFYLWTPCNIGQNVLLEKKLETLMKTY